MNTLSAKADSFSDKLCGNPLAWRPKARPRPRKCSVMNDDRRRCVPGHARSAIADVHTLSQCFLGDLSATGAFLACSSWINAFDDATSIRSFVGRKSDDLCPQGVIDFFGQHSSCQAFDVEIFERDLSEPSNQITAQFMGEVTTAVGYTTLIDGKALPGLGATFRAPLSSGQFTLSTSQALGVLLGEVWPVDHLAVGQSAKTCKAKIDPNARPIDPISAFDLDMKDDVPLAKAARENGALRLAWQITMPFGLDLAWHADNTQPVGLADRKAITDTKVGRMESARSSKSRIPSLTATLYATEEPVEGFLNTTQDLLFSAERPARKIGIRKTCGFEFAGLINIPKSFFAAFPCLNSLLETCVIQTAKVVKHLAERFGLNARRVNTVLVRENLRGYARLCHGASSTVSGRGALARCLAAYYPHIDEMFNLDLGLAPRRLKTAVPRGVL